MEAAFMKIVPLWVTGWEKEEAGMARSLEEKQVQNWGHIALLICQNFL